MKNIFLRRPIKALILLGLWFVPEKHRKPYLIYRTILASLQYSFLLLNIVYMWVVWGDLNEVSEGSYLLFTEATLCLKVTTFLLSKERLSRLLDFMEGDIFSSTTPVHDRILSMQGRKIWKVSIFFLTCAMCNCTEWAVVPLLDSHQPRHFPFKIWMPLNPAKSLDYGIGYTYQMSTVYTSPMLYIAIDFITLSTISFASGQIKIIVHKLREIKSIPFSDSLNIVASQELIRNNNKILNDCICQHQAVIRFVKLVEHMFNVNIFFQMSGTVAIICIIGLSITSETPNTFHFYSSLNYLVFMLAQLYMYSWCGNELTAKSEMLRDELYMCPWYEQDIRFKKTLYIAMEAMKRPIVFRAGFYIPLSRPTFVSILRCSYSYFAVLNQASNK